MVLGAYALHLYCDSEREQPLRTPGHPNYGDANPVEIEGRSEHECRRVAKERGWVLRGGRAICPLCAKQKPP